MYIVLSSLTHLLYRIQVYQMKWKLTIVAFACFYLSQTWADTLAPERQKELIYLLRQDCGACHGMNLRGGLGPSLLPESLKPMSVNQVAQTILNGRPGTPMPPWKPFMSEPEALWLANQLKTGIKP